MIFVRRFKIISCLFLWLIVCDISYGKPSKLSDLESPSAESSHSLWDDLFSYFDDTSDTSEEEEDSSEELFDNWPKQNPESQSDQDRKYEFCRDCNISYLSVNSTQYINHYNQVSTEKANGKPTPREATSMEEATKNGATTKDATTQTTVSPKAIITTTTIQPILLTTTTPKSSKDTSIIGGVDSDDNATPTTTMTTTTTTIKTVSATTNFVDMTTIPPAPVPLDDEPLLDPSDKMPSEEALTSEEKV